MVHKTLIIINIREFFTKLYIRYCFFYLNNNYFIMDVFIFYIFIIIGCIY